MFKWRSERDQLACDMYNHVCCFERKLRWFHSYNFLREIPHSLSCFCRATRTPDCTTFRPTSLVEKPQKEFYFCEAQRIILVPGRWKSSRCNRLRTLNRTSWKRNLNRSSATTCRVTSILVYIAMLWRWHHCLTACICARGCSVGWSTVSQGWHWFNQIDLIIN